MIETTWNPDDRTVTVHDRGVVSVWSGVTAYADGNPGQGRGYQLNGINLESVEPRGVPSDSAEVAAWKVLWDHVDEIGAAKYE